MIERIIIAGAGGQGIITLGKMLARAAINTYPFMTFFPCYGAEVRGGTSYCQVILSSDEISSPLAETFDVIIAMNQPSAGRFMKYSDRKGLILVNRTLCKVKSGRNIVGIHATDVADQLGNVKAANLVMLGAMLARKSIVPLPDIENEIKISFAGFSKAIAQINMRAFHRGLSL